MEGLRPLGKEQEVTEAVERRTESTMTCEHPKL